MKRRESSVTKKCRMLCPQCGVRQVKEPGDPIILDCGHSRGEILPLQPGRISLENLKTEIGRECFPAKPLSDLPDEEQPLNYELLGLPVSSDEAIAVCVEALNETHEEIEY
jgi:hypothetical protein